MNNKVIADIKVSTNDTANKTIFDAKLQAVMKYMPELEKQIKIYDTEKATPNYYFGTTAIKIRGLLNKAIYAWQELMFECDKQPLLLKDLKVGDVYTIVDTKMVYVKSENTTLDGNTRVVKLTPASLSAEVRGKRDSLFVQANSPDPSQRLMAMVGLREMLIKGDFPKTYIYPLIEGNNHCHSNHDHNSAGTLEYHAMLYKLLGLKRQGHVCHDSLNGMPDFYLASKILGFEAMYGIELRVQMDEKNKEYNFPDVNGTAYCGFHFAGSDILFSNLFSNRWLIEGIRTAKVERLNKFMQEINTVQIELNGQTINLGLDFQKDINELTALGDSTYSTDTTLGNPTEKHLSEAVARKITLLCNGDVNKIEIVLTQIITKLRELLKSSNANANLINSIVSKEVLSNDEKKLFDNPIKWVDVVRNKVIKILLAMYPTTSKEVQSASYIVDQMNKEGWLSYYLLLDGVTCEMEKPENLTETLMEAKEHGANGVGIIRNRVLVEAELKVAELAEEIFGRNLSIIDALDVNKPDMTAVWYKTTKLEERYADAVAQCVKDFFVPTANLLQYLQNYNGRKADYLQLVEQLRTDGILD